MIISNCRIINLSNIINDKGSLVFIEGINHIPFGIKRVYYIYDTPKGVNRGGHAHKNLHQLIIAIKGSFDVFLDDGTERKIFCLEKPNQGLYVPPMIWHKFSNFTSDAISLVFVSELFSNEETVRSYDTFKKIVKK
jgi:dTDP-4-dehydrorhamnose 3,5-epimerase-like enzyme